MMSENFLKNTGRFQLPLALVYMTFLIASTCCAYRIVLIGPIVEPGSTLIYMFSFLFCNIFSEMYGPKATKKLIWISILCGFLFASLVTFINWLPAPSYWSVKNNYDVVFGRVLYFSFFATIGHIIASFINNYVITLWKVKTKGRFFGIRSFVALVISESFSTFFVGIITFLGLIAINKTALIMFNAVIFKILYGAIIIWPISIIVFILKRFEKDVTEIPTANPFDF